jgi:predicted phosphodiesterase
MTALREFYQLAEYSGCDCVLHCGDLVDGIKTQPDHLRAFTSPNALTNYVISEYPDNLTTYWITGNHETRLYHEVEVDIVREIGKERSDIACVGRNEALYTHKNVCFYMYHESGTNSPREHMKIACANSKGSSIVLCGHLHRYRKSKVEGKPGIMVPSFQSTPPYMKSRSAIGGVLITIGEDRSPVIELVTYDEKEKGTDY